jgi:hypothetical protein
MKLIYRYEAEADVVGGTWEDSSLDMSAGAICRQVYVRPTTPTTTYEFEIYDYKDRLMRRFITVTDIINDLTEFPVKGRIKMKIVSSSVDEPFDVMLMFENN